MNVKENLQLWNDLTKKKKILILKGGVLISDREEPKVGHRGCDTLSFYNR